ncbi:hypothetical protein L9Z73_30845, partial [Pseudomonas sp. TNT11]|nr:hypothetical protein [Pseudomonas emilianonis]
MSTDGASSPSRLLPRLLGVLLLIMGLALLAGGIKLSLLGGSLYYLLAGIGITLTGLLLLATRRAALGYPALQLLIERAMSHQDSFALSEAELPLAIDICQRLDGIPLAIELVAAQIERFGLPGLLVQMEDNFRLLTRGRRSALPRQQTLRATLDWSFDLLSPCEQICLRRLAVFRGGFSLA